METHVYLNSLLGRKDTSMRNYGYFAFHGSKSMYFIEM